jgi:hypothetical protein
MEERDRIGNAGNKSPHREAVLADVEAASSSRGEILAQTVGLVIGKRELLGWDLKADVA